MYLIFTLDYELFGNGSGDVFKHIIIPTYKLLDICNKKNIKITIFFEVLEYLRLKYEWDNGNKMSYTKNPAQSIVEQIQKAHINGHDIQLHLHPQWINAKYKNGWDVDKSLWRLSNVSKDKCNYSISELLCIGKKTIEGIIKPITPDYRCNVLRAGGYNVYPSKEIYRAMKENSFLADSSIISGAFIDDGLSHFDYRQIKPNISYWFAKNSDLLKQSFHCEEGDCIIEIPIFSLPIRRYNKYDTHRLKVKLNNSKYSKQQIKQKIGKKSIFQKFKYFFEKEVVTWDFCLFNYRKMKLFLNAAKKIAHINQDKLFAFVLIGHTKEFIYSNHLLRFIKQNKHIKFISMSDYINRIRIAKKL